MSHRLHTRIQRHLHNHLTRPSLPTPTARTLTTTTTGPRHFSSSPSNQRSTPSTQKPPPNFAFAFDIDGVLLRSSTPIPSARSTLTHLLHNHIPLILLTNGGGKSEVSRATDLNSKLNLTAPYTLNPTQLIQSHTPLKELATSHGNPSYKDKCVLVVGGDRDACRAVAESYGFSNVVVPADIYTAYPDLWPFSSNFTDYYSSFARPLPRPVNLDASDLENESLKIDAVFVFNDPRDWGLDCQLLADIMLSHGGVVGTYSARNGKREMENHGYQSDGQPPLYFSNPDLLWASAYPLPRLGQGGFREALCGVWGALTKTASGAAIPLKYTIMGKPHRLTYEYAERQLLEQRVEAYGGDVQGRWPLETVYMVGDNPESDIRGANGYESLVGARWRSVLVRTGVFRGKEGEGEGDGAKAGVVVGDVGEGVRWALGQSGWEGSVD